jgi:hypothetical protein
VHRGEPMAAGVCMRNPARGAHAQPSKGWRWVHVWAALVEAAASSAAEEDESVMLKANMRGWRPCGDLAKGKDSKRGVKANGMVRRRPIQRGNHQFPKSMQ